MSMKDLYILYIFYKMNLFYILISFSISFFIDLKFLSQNSLTCLVGITARYIILFVAIVKASFP